MPISQRGVGRDHNPGAMTVWMAGAGIKGGQAIGASDEFGYKAEQQPISYHDLHATILHLLGHRSHEADVSVQRPRHAADRRLRRADSADRCVIVDVARAFRLAVKRGRHACAADISRARRSRHCSGARQHRSPPRSCASRCSRAAISLGGQPFGAAGPYEKIAGKIFFAVDPALPGEPHRDRSRQGAAQRRGQGRVLLRLLPDQAEGHRARQRRRAVRGVESRRQGDARLLQPRGGQRRSRRRRPRWATAS